MGSKCPVLLCAFQYLHVFSKVILDLENTLLSWPPGHLPLDPWPSPSVNVLGEAFPATEGTAGSSLSALLPLSVHSYL